MTSERKGGRSRLLMIRRVLLLIAVLLALLIVISTCIDKGVFDGTDKDESKGNDISAQTKPDVSITSPSETPDEDKPSAPPTADGADTETVKPEKNGALKVIIIILYALLGLDLAGAAMTYYIGYKLRRRSPPPNGVPANEGLMIGRLQDIGKREAQQDSCGVAMLSDGALAVVADGMGSLEGSERISQTIVSVMTSLCGKLRENQFDNVLPNMVQYANNVINKMQEQSKSKISGSTLVAVLLRKDRFHWISIGDSRIYLYRGGSLIQLNQEHTLEQELLLKAINGELSFEEVRQHPKRRGLTSFIGMGRLKYVDMSFKSIRLLPGDRILLMTDGVFNTISESGMADVLKANPNVQTAADIFGSGIKSAGLKHQDNYTAVILGF